MLPARRSLRLWGRARSWRRPSRGERQVLAANVDVILSVQPLGAERDTLPLMRDRAARSLVLARDCGAEPVVVLTKVDRCEAAEVLQGVEDGEIERVRVDAFLALAREMRVSAQSLDPDIHL